jgi:polyisoprenoid-binding protein YceI
MTSRIEIDQRAGDLTLHTGRAGVGSKVGHDLTLRVGRWSAQADLDDAGDLSALRLVAALDSLEVLRGDGGLKPLSEKDKKTILANAMDTMKARAHPELSLDAPDLRVAAGQSRITGQVSLAGATRPQIVDLTVTRAGGQVQVQARCDLVQSDFGIKPYSGMLGALKVRDAVEVRADLTISAP